MLLSSVLGLEFSGLKQILSTPCGCQFALYVRRINSSSTLLIARTTSCRKQAIISRTRLCGAHSSALWWLPAPSRYALTTRLTGSFGAERMLLAAVSRSVPDGAAGAVLCAVRSSLAHARDACVCLPWRLWGMFLCRHHITMATDSSFARPTMALQPRLHEQK